MISCVMSIYGFYSTNLVLRRPETSATDKHNFVVSTTVCLYRASFSSLRANSIIVSSPRSQSSVLSATL